MATCSTSFGSFGSEWMRDWEEVSCSEINIAFLGRVEKYTYDKNRAF